jgi:hypothetical protein
LHIAAVWYYLLQACTKEKHDFVSKIFKASGISYTNAALPACLQPTMTDEPKTDMLSAQVEAKMVLGQVVADVLHKTGAMLVLLPSCYVAAAAVSVCRTSRDSRLCCSAAAAADTIIRMIKCGAAEQSLRFMQHSATAQAPVEQQKSLHKL